MRVIYRTEDGTDFDNLVTARQHEHRIRRQQFEAANPQLGAALAALPDHLVAHVAIAIAAAAEPEPEPIPEEPLVGDATPL